MVKNYVKNYSSLQKPTELPPITVFYKKKNLEDFIDEYYHDIYNYILLNYPCEMKWSEKLYRFYNGIEEDPVCDVCGKKLKFKGLSLGYGVTCSTSCKKRSKLVLSKMQNTCMKKYGVKNPYESKEIKDKIKRINLKKYGKEYASQSDEIIQKTKQTNLERYGVTCTVHNQKIQEKVKQTNLERYGVENPFSSQEVKDQIKQTMIERYGVEHASQSDEIIQKTKQTNLERYGVENPFSSQEVKDQIKQTMIERYGVEHALQSEEFKKKFIETNLERYGVDYVSKLSNFREKIYNTKRKHNSFHVSKIENQFKLWLENHNIEYYYQYKCDEYPFMCDFYIPLKHLYIEIQGNWVHGFHPFDQNNQNDIDLLNKWKNKNTPYYDTAIEIWTINDVKKRQWAKERNLNWVEVFSIKLEDVINTIKDLI